MVVRPLSGTLECRVKNEQIQDLEKDLATTETKICPGNPVRRRDPSSSQRSKDACS